MTKFEYRPEIDGLRAIAVLSVVLYHAGFTNFSGGYVGVDVFFVISGYLITNLIVREVRETGGFRFGRFYMRRIRRLFPALLSTVLASWIAAFLLFSPAQMQDFAYSTLAALTSLSNFYFWQEANYFDTAAITKPLLHTWSLSVEEQFYLVWPALIVLGFAKLRSRLALAALVALCLTSLGFAEYWNLIDQVTSFYMLPARVAELGIGAALVWVKVRQSAHNWVLEAGAIGGLSAIAWSVFAYGHATPFPGLMALWPCFGAAMFIHCSKARYSGGILRARPMVWIGKISYSLYLVHWPLLVFYTHLFPGAASNIGNWMILVLSIGLGWLQYRFIESRFRYGINQDDISFARVAAVCVLLVAVPSTLAARTDGLGWRVPEKRAWPTDMEWRKLASQRYCSSPAPKDTWAGDNPDTVTCQNYRDKTHSIYIWGDSHALHLAAGFATAYPDHNIHVIYMNNCIPQSGFANFISDTGGTTTKLCVDHNRNAMKLLVQDSKTNIVITSAKRLDPGRIAPAANSMMQKLRAAGHQVAFLADFIRPGRSIYDCMSVPQYLISDTHINQHCFKNFPAAQRELIYNQQLAALAPDLIAVDDLQCSNSTCKFLHHGKPLHRDHHHLNIDGSVYFVDKLKPRLPFKTTLDSKLSGDTVQETEKSNL